MRKKKLQNESIRLIFGKKIRRLRRDLDWTQEKLAEQAGMHATYIGQIERGQRNVSLDMIASLAKALNCRPELFFEDVDLDKIKIKSRKKKKT